MAKNPDELMVRELKDTIKQLNETIKSLNAMLEEHRTREHVLQEQIDYLTKKLFGTSSEKRKAQIEGQMSLFNEAEEAASENDPEPIPETIVREHTRKSKPTNKDKYANLPKEVVIVELPESEMSCPECGTKLVRIGKKHIRDEVQFIPAEMKVISYYSAVYGCPECCAGNSPSGRGVIVEASIKPALIEGSPASSSSAAWVIYQKYANSVPLYRQEQDWKTLHGVTLTRATLGKWVIKCSLTHYKPMFNYFRGELLKRGFAMADESPIQVLKEPDKKPQSESYMWLFRTGEDGGPPIILYKYSPSRAKYNAEDFLKGFNGYLETDGYQGYNNLPGVRRCCCWAHVRRAFCDAIQKGHDGDLSDPAVQGVAYCDKLFDYERRSHESGHSFEERYKYRLEKEKPVLEAFWKWLDTLTPVKNSRLYKAKYYTLNRKEFLETYLEDGRCSLSNNLSENAIRPFTVGRKNWLFSDTVNGAEASALCYTMVEMAKANNLNVYKYLKYILDHRPTENDPPEKLKLLAPWNEEVRKICSVTKEETAGKE